MNGLAAYWGKACWNTDVKAILESLSQTPTGAYMDVIELLPPLPTSLLYTFPIPDNPLNGPVVRRDCHWTSFNFFRDVPDDRFNNEAYVVESLKRDYYPATGDPRFGDLVTLITTSSQLLHSAVYIADDVVYTKNGPLVPWKLSTLDDMKKEYEFGLPPGTGLAVNFFRNKAY